MVAVTAGTISGVRFYKGAGNTGTHTGSLWSTSGQLLATATFTNETASGWQTVLFSSPVAITAGTTYVASYHAPVGHYASDEQFFVNQFDNAPLHAFASSSGGNGVYLYGSTSAFPNQTYHSTNYWVDVLFTPTSGTSSLAQAVNAPATTSLVAVDALSLDPTETDRRGR